MSTSINKVEIVTRVSAHGNSLNINVTREVKIMGLGRGDLVKVTIERIPDGEEVPPEQ